MLCPTTQALAETVIIQAQKGSRRLVTAESCTGGLVAAALTSVSGASAVVERGFVTYSNTSKEEVLGVPPGTIDLYGAVSAQVAEAMAQGALLFSHADLAISTTGIAGPTGGTADKPVGLVYIGFASRAGIVMHTRMIFTGDRATIRDAAVNEALRLLSLQTTDSTPIF